MKINGTARANKVKLFTHTDLDGVGCAVLMKKAYGDLIDIDLIPANKSDEFIRNWLSNGQALAYTKLYITDLTIDVTTADLIEKSPLNAQLLDHHETNSGDLKGRNWCIIGNELQCGTSLVYTFLTMHSDLSVKEFQEYEKFVEHVENYDTWKWVEKNDKVAKDLSDLLYILGKRTFFERFVEDSSVELSRDEKMLLSVDRDKMKTVNYMNKMSYSELKIPYAGSYITLGIVPGNRYVNDLASEVLAEHSNIDAVAVISIPGVMSLRSNGKFDVEVLAKVLGGGGHKESSGAFIGADLFEFSVKTFLGSKGIQTL